jgi:ABC-type transporter Mla maintaining outer membrane lipid asymmetry permease subunit MlaE
MAYNGSVLYTMVMELVLNFKAVLIALTGAFVVASLFFGTRNGFYDTDKYHGNGSAH